MKGNNVAVTELRFTLEVRRDRTDSAENQINDLLIHVRHAPRMQTR